MEDWSGGISCLISEGGGRMYSLWVGIDVSKYFFATAGINSEGKESFPRSYLMGKLSLIDFINPMG